jgi:hypothetical protein
MLYSRPLLCCEDMHDIFACKCSYIVNVPTAFHLVTLYWAIVEAATQILIPHYCSVCRTALILCHESLFCECNGVFNSAYDALLSKRFNDSI